MEEKKMLKLRRSYLFALPLVALPLWGLSGYADNILGPALSTFAVLGHTTVTNVPTSTIGGSVGVTPGTAITGSGGIVFTSGTLQANTSISQAAAGELTNAITNTASGLMPPTIQLMSSELAGLTLFPGVYSFSTNAGGFAQLTGTSANPGKLILDGQGNANATWVFQTASTLTTSAATTGTTPSSVVSVINTGSGAGVFWNVGSSATIGTFSTFEGNILALGSISMNTGATDLCGRVLASTGQVSLQMNTIDIGCSGILADSNGLSGGTGSTTTTGSGETGGTTSVPEPNSLLTLSAGIVVLIGGLWKNRAKAA